MRAVVHAVVAAAPVCQKRLAGASVRVRVVASDHRVRCQTNRSSNHWRARSAGVAQGASAVKSVKRFPEGGCAILTREGAQPVVEQRHRNVERVLPVNVNMLKPDRGQLRQVNFSDPLALVLEVINGGLHVDRVPGNDGIDDEVKAVGLVEVVMWSFSPLFN